MTQSRNVWRTEKAGAVRNTAIRNLGEIALTAKWGAEGFDGDQVAGFH